MLVSVKKTSVSWDNHAKSIRRTIGSDKKANEKASEPCRETSTQNAQLHSHHPRQHESSSVLVFYHQSMKWRIYATWEMHAHCKILPMLLHQLSNNLRHSSFFLILSIYMKSKEPALKAAKSEYAEGQHYKKRNPVVRQLYSPLAGCSFPSHPLLLPNYIVNMWNGWTSLVRECVLQKSQLADSRISRSHTYSTLSFTPAYAERDPHAALPKCIVFAT